MSTALAERPQAVSVAAPSSGVTAEQLELVKKTVANGATPAELQLYLYDCARQGVHPLDRLLHFTKRGGKYTPVTSIDLMRIRAAETGDYAGSDDAEFVGDNASPDIFAAKVTVWRLVQGSRCSFTATARWSEYFPGEAGGHMWRKMPHTMLGKCAEALALRKGFPRQLAGLYAAEEMDQADKPRNGGYVVEAPVAPVVTSTQESRQPSKPNGGDSDSRPSGAEASPDAALSGDSNLPAGAVLIAKVENGWGQGSKAKGFIHVGAGESYPVYDERLATLAAEVCQSREPVKLTFKTSGAGKRYITAIVRVPLPESWQPFAHKPPKADAEIGRPSDDDIVF